MGNSQKKLSDNSTTTDYSLLKTKMYTVNQTLETSFGKITLPLVFIRLPSEKMLDIFLEYRWGKRIAYLNSPKYSGYALKLLFL